MLVALAFVGTAGAAPAQEIPPPARELVLGISTSTPLLADGNGTRVRSGLAPVVAAHLVAVRGLPGDMYAGVTVRGARSSLSLRDDGERWNGGSVWQVDVMADATWRRGPFSLTGAIGATWLRAARRVRPLEHARVLPTGEIGVGIRRTGSPWGARLGLQAYTLPVHGGQGGGVMRAIIGIAHGL